MYQRRPYYYSSRSGKAGRSRATEERDRGTEGTAQVPAQSVPMPDIPAAAPQRNMASQIGLQSQARASAQAGTQSQTNASAQSGTQSRAGAAAIAGASARPTEVRQPSVQPAMRSTAYGSSQEGRIRTVPQTAPQNIGPEPDIPMPYEPERYRSGLRRYYTKPQANLPANLQKSKGFSLAKLFGKKIGIEELILFVLIMILLDEGLEDELLFLLLVYIFFDFVKN